MEIAVAIAMIAAGLWLIRKSFWLGLFSFVIGFIALLSPMGLLDKAENVPSALLQGVTSFLGALGV